MTSERKKRARKIAVGLAVVIVIAIVALGFVKPGVTPAPTERDIPAETFTPQG